MYASGKKRAEDGFTLIEVILSIVIISALVAAMAYILTIGLDSYSLIVERREALQRARLAVNMMDAELQSISDPSTDISSISSTSITFVGSAGTITYAISGGVLTRTDSSGSSTLAGSIAGGSEFQYYTAGGGTTTTPSLVYRIGITLGVTAGGSGGTVVIKGNVYLRNRYYDSFNQI